MSVGVQGKACGEVPQHAGYRLDIHTVLEGQCCESMPQVMETHLRQSYGEATLLSESYQFSTAA